MINPTHETIPLIDITDAVAAVAAMSNNARSLPGTIPRENAVSSFRDNRFILQRIRYIMYRPSRTIVITIKRSFQVTLHNAGLFECAVGIEVVNPNARAPQNAVAGSIGDIAERDEHTGAIRLAGGQQVGVPIVVKDEGAKLVEIRAMDPTTGVLYASLRLKNQVME